MTYSAIDTVASNTSLSEFTAELHRPIGRVYANLLDPNWLIGLRTLRHLHNCYKACWYLYISLFLNSSFFTQGRDIFAKDNRLTE